nr:hypothetical protein [Tanacetum cinerariifolium]
TERGSNDTEELVNVLTFMDVENILTSGGVQVVSVPPVTEVPTSIIKCFTCRASTYTSSTGTRGNLSSLAVGKSSGSENSSLAVGMP